MLINISDPIFQTVFFSVIFYGFLLIFIRKKQDEGILSKEVTSELKGFAIFTVIFSHIGYFLSSDPRFLYPFSILAGVGVNLFLFLSGFGLAFSHFNSPISPFSFYKKRLSKIFIPLWIIITIFLLTDFFVLHRSYPLPEIIYSFLGFYPRADIFLNLDSPLWYFSVILFYYLIFPLVYIKKFPLLSPILVLTLSLLVLNLPLPINVDVLKLYKLHFLAFPLGMLFGLTIQNFRFKLNRVLKFLILTIAVLIFIFTSVNSGVGQDSNIEQSISLLTTLSLLIIFSLSKFNFKLLSFFGVYSYEIYLLHWPILSRYNLFLGLPSFLMITLNLLLLIFLAYILQIFFTFCAKMKLLR